MGKERIFFKRDISWLSFNFRVLMEAQDDSVPLFDRIRFLSIYSSNLEEFFRIRVSEYRHTIRQKETDEEEKRKAEETLCEINAVVEQQQLIYDRIFTEQILPSLAQNGITLYQGGNILPIHETFIRTYFNEEIFPYLQPVLILKDDIRSFLRDKRLYLIIRLYKKRVSDTDDQKPYYALIKIPYAKVPRFIELPSEGGQHYLMFVEDLIAKNLPTIFPGFVIDSHYCIRISRDADFTIDGTGDNLVDEIRKNVNKRKLGTPNRLVHDSRMPQEFLSLLCEAYQIAPDRCIPAGPYRTLEDLIKLPNPTQRTLTEVIPEPLRVTTFDRANSIYEVIKQQDVLLYYPYHSFDYLIRFLAESAYDPNVREIKITQYRVAENSAVIHSLITAAKNGKQVTVYVELKARFDEENNIESSEMMQRAGIRIVYSQPGLKVHAKIALVIRNHPDSVADTAYLSTGNFNEKTARTYSDMGLFTGRPGIINELKLFFSLLEGENKTTDFKTLLVSPFNMVETLKSKLLRETEEARAGRKAHVILKMNGLQDKEMINALYDASEAGVQIEIIVRGICCLVPNQPYSRNIRLFRLVDQFLEHARIWYFHAGGKDEIYLSSADWMKRNLTRRIETAFPVYNPEIKDVIKQTLLLQLNDNQKMCLIDENLQNIYQRNGDSPLRAQTETYRMLKKLDW